MRRVLRFAIRTALGLGILFLGALGAVYAFSQTDRFREIVRDEVVTRGSEVIRGEIGLGALEGSVWSEIVLRDLGVREGGKEVLRVPAVRLRYRLLSLLSGRLRLEAIELERPDLRLRQDAEGAWNLLRALAPAATGPAPATEGGSLPLAIDLDSLKITSLQASVEPWGGEPVRLRDVDLAASASVTETGVTAKVEKLRGRIELAERPPLRLAAALRYDGTAVPPVLRIAAATLETDRSRLDLSGSVRGLERPETDLRLVVRLAADDVNVFVAGVGLRPDVTGEITVQGPARELRSNVALAAGEAALTATLTADLTQKALPWQTRLAVAEVDLAKLLERADAAGRFAARLEARGQGAAPESLGGEASIEARSLAWGEWRPGDVLLDVRVAERRAAIDARLEPGRGSARLDGEVDFSGGERFDLRLVAERLAPLRTADGEPSGEVSLDARLRGSGFSPATLEARLDAEVRPSTLGELSLRAATLAATAAEGGIEGSLDVARFRSGDTRFDAARATFGAKGIDGETPRANVELGVESLAAGVELRRLEIDTDAVFGDPIESTIVVRAVDRDRRAHHAEATVTAGDERLRVVVGRLELDLPGGAWRLAQPATVERRGDELTIDRLLARSGSRRVSLAGRVSVSGRQDLRLDVEGVDLASFAPLLPRDVAPAGRLAADARLEGTAAAPVFEARLEARDLRVSAARAEALDATLTYREGEARLVLDLRQDETHALSARARVPLTVAWAPSWTLEPARASRLPLDVRLRSDGLDLAFLEAFGEGSFEKVRGTLALDVSVGGTAARPEPRGSVSLRDGAADLVPLGVDVRELGAELVLAPEALRVERLSARAGKGRLEGAGHVALRDFAPGAVEATLTLEKWPAVRTRRYEATLGGEISAGGTVDAPDVEGRIEVLSATLRPDLRFLGHRPPERDETITLVGEGAPAPEPSETEEDGPEVAATVNRFERLSLDLAVAMQRNVWVKQQGTAIELAGDVEVRKPRGGALRVVGRIVTRRGWARFQGKRFRLVEGEIRFTGGKTIDPSLDVIARHRVREYTVDVVVGGTASAPKLELRSAPPLEQADILSVLLFGKPASELSEGEQSELGDEAAALAASFAVSEVSQKVTEALGIEHLGIQIEELSTDRAAVGAYVTERTYVSVGQDLSGDEGREVSVEYEVLPPNWSVVTSTSTSGESGADVIWKKRY